MLSLKEGAPVLFCLIIATQEGGLMELEILNLSVAVIQTLARVGSIPFGEMREGKPTIVLYLPMLIYKTA